MKDKVFSILNQIFLTCLCTLLIWKNVYQDYGWKNIAFFFLIIQWTLVQAENWVPLLLHFFIIGSISNEIIVDNGPWYWWMYIIYVAWLCMALFFYSIPLGAKEYTIASFSISAAIAFSYKTIAFYIFGINMWMAACAMRILFMYQKIKYMIVATQTISFLGLVIYEYLQYGSWTEYIADEGWKGNSTIYLLLFFTWTGGYYCCYSIAKHDYTEETPEIVLHAVVLLRNGIYPTYLLEQIPCCQTKLVFHDRNIPQALHLLDRDIPTGDFFTSQEFYYNGFNETGMSAYKVMTDMSRNKPLKRFEEYAVLAMQRGARPSVIQTAMYKEIMMRIPSAEKQISKAVAENRFYAEISELYFQYPNEIDPIFYVSTLLKHEPASFP